jgi:cell division septal protein FtsQ
MAKKVAKKSKKKVTSKKNNVEAKNIKTRKNNVKPKTIKVKKRKLRISRVLILLIFCFLLIIIWKLILNIKIKSIFIIGNSVLTDEEIIEIANLDSYPSYVSTLKSSVASTLSENVYIISANVKKKKFREIYIEIEENTPLFYDNTLEKTILKDGSQVDEKFNTPILLNYVPDTLYDLFKEKLLLIDEEIYMRISEIQYDPNEVDDKRFYLTMNDGNSVYLTLKTFEKLNNYLDILKEVISKYKDKKGILFLDEGEYFEVFND